jgi:hypothetical protein
MGNDILSCQHVAVAWRTTHNTIPRHAVSRLPLVEAISYFVTPSASADQHWGFVLPSVRHSCRIRESTTNTYDAAEFRDPVVLGNSVQRSHTSLPEAKEKDIPCGKVAFLH